MFSTGVMWNGCIWASSPVLVRDTQTQGGEYKRSGCDAPPRLSVKSAIGGGGGWRVCQRGGVWLEAAAVGGGGASQGGGA